MNVRPVMRWGLMLPPQLSEFNVSNWREQSEPGRGLPVSIYHLHKMVSHYHSYIRFDHGCYAQNISKSYQP